ncbi:MAG TPA: 4'-phosphopantetheinyl transferase superfamily protein [Vicinamibacterales bacterium]|jgi:4'-phosphopantetheinyl transferase
MDGVTAHQIIRFERPRVRIDIVGVTVDDGRSLERWMAHASRARRAKAARYRLVADKIRCLASEALLRYSLRDELQIDLDAASLVDTHLGKPFLADHPDLHFNLSHSGEWIACAMAAGPVGIDVEVVHPMVDLPAAQFMSGDELERHLDLDPGARVHNFYRLWTIKECVLKALGTGFSLDPRQLTVRQEGAQLFIEGIPAPSDEASWEVRALDMPEGVYAAVCAAAPGPAPSSVPSRMVRTRSATSK